MVRIEVTPFSYRLAVSTIGQISGTNVYLENYLKRFNHESWDFKTRRMSLVKRYVYYNRKTNMLHLPRYDLLNFCKFLSYHKIEYDVIELPLSYGKDVDIQLKPGVKDRNERQTASIDYLTNSTEHIRGLSLNTGCLTGFNIISCYHSEKEFLIPLNMLYHKFNGFYKKNDIEWNTSIDTYVRSFNGKTIELHKIKDVVYSGIKPVYRIGLNNGNWLVCTSCHEIMTDQGFIRSENILGYMVMYDNGNMIELDNKSINHIKESHHPSYTKAISYEYIGEEPTYDIICEEPYRNFVANGIVVHNSGKSYCSIRTISNLGKRAMISVVGLVDQWEREFYNFTTLTPDDIYIIQGAPSMMKLLSQIDRNIHPKVILCSLGTIRNYVLDKDMYENCPPFEELMDRLGVGVRIADEAHLNFWLSMMVDLRTNANVNIALTATFERTDHKVKLIFNAHYPRSIRFGEDEYSRYIDVYSYNYTLGGMLLPMKAYTTIKGYNHSKFEDYLLRRTPTKLEYIYAIVYSPIIFSKYINIKKPGQKLLIICSTIDMCNWFKHRLNQDLFNEYHLKINIYIGETDDFILAESDIIISTPGSAGTGVDIKNLKTMLVTVAVGSSPLNKQMMGRLRELPNGETPIYTYTWCRDIQSHCNYEEERKRIYIQRGKSFNEIKLG